MIFEIDQEIREKTPCQKWFICLSGDQDLLCRVEKRDGDYLCLQERSPLSQRLCSMRNEEGGRVRCFCPVRIAIYEKYGQ